MHKHSTNVLRHIDTAEYNHTRTNLRKREKPTRHHTVYAYVNNVFGAPTREVSGMW